MENTCNKGLIAAYLEEEKKKSPEISGPGAHRAAGGISLIEGMKSLRPLREEVRDLTAEAPPGAATGSEKISI